VGVGPYALLHLPHLSLNLVMLALLNVEIFIELWILLQQHLLGQLLSALQVIAEFSCSFLLMFHVAM